MAKYRILSIDGGGVKGAFTLQVLRMLEEDLRKEGFLLFENIDCFCGVSTGALICIALLAGHKPKEILLLYEVFGSLLFKRSGGGDNHAKYSIDLLSKSLGKIIPKNATFADLSRHCIIPSCQLHDQGLKRWAPAIYDNYDLNMAKELKLLDVALRSSAAPIYFPSYQKNIDGGIYVSNPSMLALARSIDLEGGRKKLDDIELLSIGTGINPSKILDEVDWGKQQWMNPYQHVADHPLFSLCVEISGQAPDYQCRQLLRDRYLRLDGILSAPVQLDEYKRISVLLDAAKQMKSSSLWEESKKWIKHHFSL